jgi:DNA mismatch repair protein MutS
MDGSENLTPMMRQYLEIKQSHQDAFLFFRLGDFYEMFFEDALKASAILDIALTSRNKGQDAKVPFCGVPHHSASNYIRKLLEEGHKVAICEQVEDPKEAKGIVRREVTRVITPGLMVEDEHLASGQPNYLAATMADGTGMHLGLVDISTGDFLLGYYETPEEVLQELLKHPVKELLLGKDEVSPAWLDTLKKNSPRLLLTNWEDKGPDPLASGNFSQELRASVEKLNSPQGRRLVGRLLGYIIDTQRSPMPHLGPLVVLKRRQFMGMDDRTFRHLELIRNQRGERGAGTLFAVLNKTKTAMGTRCLAQWIHYPLLDLEVITGRQDAIQEWLDHPETLVFLQDHLQKIQDIERMLGKISLGTVNARDLAALGRSLQASQKLIRELGPAVQCPLLRGLFLDLPSLWELGELLLAQLVEAPPLTVREGGMIAVGVHPELDELRGLSRDGKGFIAQMEINEKERTGIGSLKIRYNKVFGYYIEVTHTHKDSVPVDYIRKQTLANAERFITPQLKEYEGRVLGAEERIKNLEYEIFSQLRHYAAEQIESLRSLAQALAQLDVLGALAQVARENRYVRPKLVKEKILILKESRHPVLERTLSGDRFIPNDIEMDKDTQRLFLITGPNMAGKSTVMRQAALAILLAQMGCFVPAKEATIGLVDQLFTRIGASDDLTQGQSTFMVEMLETAHIVRFATEHSFIVMDEIGRGTSTYDGMSIAWAVAEYVAQSIRCRAMFATHYHELTELSQTVDGIVNYQVAVKEWNDEILFLRKLIPGGASRSYGIEVARLAQLPEDLLKRAKGILTQWEDLEGKALKKIEGRREEIPQLELFAGLSDGQRAVLEELEQIPLEQLSPLDALNFLYKIRQRLN